MERMQAAPLFPDEANLAPEQRLLRVHELLLQHFGRPPLRQPLDPLTQLIASLLSTQIRSGQAQHVMRDLRRHYANWEDLRDAPIEEIVRVVMAIPSPEVMASRLKLVLLQITARYGSLTLEFLARYKTGKVREWLESFEGVGPQISAAVVNFSTLRRRALCVDADHLRVTQRLALTPRADAGVTEQRLMRIIPESWDAVRLDEHHELVKLHGQTLCTFAQPQCAICPLLRLCPFGNRRMRAEG